jgi:hypothetical protein
MSIEIVAMSYALLRGRARTLVQKRRKTTQKVESERMKEKIKDILGGQEGKAILRGPNMSPSSPIRRGNALHAYAKRSYK